MYVRGDGVQLDYKEALHWFKRSSDQGHPQALMSLGLLYYNGWGVRQDHEEALKLCLLAADKGDDTAKKVLGSMLKHRKGRIASGEGLASK
jgi:TPR repeat protein